jgi:hypothetical protein
VAAVEAIVAGADDLALDPSAPVVVSGVGQGHLPLALRAAGLAGPVRLVDRDLLALRTAAANLAAGGAEEIASAHVPRPEAGSFAGAALVVAGLPEREPVAVTATLLADALGGGGGLPVLLHGRAADLSRVVELLARRGVRLDGRRHKVGGHGAFLGRTR